MGASVSTETGDPVLASPASFPDLLMRWVTDGKIVGEDKPKRPSSHLVVGSACSGICAEMKALDLLGWSHSAAFICEKDEKLRRLSQCMHAVPTAFPDVMSMEFLQNSATCDVLVSGFPCQPYSQAGSGRGFADMVNGGFIWTYLCKWLFLHRPAVFLLENVPGLLRQEPETFWLLLTTLSNMPDSHGQPLYDVSWKILCCSEHGYLPQNRRRIFIAGTLKSACRSTMVWPGAVPMQPLQNYIDAAMGTDEDLFALSASERRVLSMTMKKLLRKGAEPRREYYMCDINSSYGNAMLGKCPTLTRCRCASGGFWITCRQRKTNLSEIASLQGMYLSDFPDSFVTGRQLRQALGNSIPVPLLARVLRSLLSCL
ncbi:ssoIIM [Symbiodinium sp. CCMP2592]|nr:ssoIIM [Symbiodinium sp. CCMP2592]